MDADFDEEAVEIKDAYLRRDNMFGGDGYVRFGNYRAPFGLEENTTSRYIMFMERSQGTDAFTIGRRMGLEVAKWSSLYRVAAGVFGPDVVDWETTDADMNVNLVGRRLGHDRAVGPPRSGATGAILCPTAVEPGATRPAQR